MEPQQENLPTSTLTTETKSLSTEKSKQKLKVRHDWIGLRAEYLSGNIVDVAEWGRAKGIPVGTLEKQAVGWKEEYLQRQTEIAQKALERLKNKKVNTVAARLRGGRLIFDRCVRAFEKKDLTKVAPKQLADMAKIGADIQNQIEDDATQQAIENLQNQVMGTQVTVTQGKGEDAVRTEIKVIAGNIARGRIDRLGRGPVVLGAGQHPDGEQPAV